MATVNPFDPLCDNDEDPSQFIATVEQQKAAAVLKQKKDAVAAAFAALRAARRNSQAAKLLPSKSDTYPSSQFVCRCGYVRDRSDAVYNRELAVDRDPNAYAYTNGPSEGYVPKPDDDGEWEKPNNRPTYRGHQNTHRRSGFRNGDAAEGRYPGREFDRRCTAYRNDLKREGGGRGNWGSTTDEIAQVVEELIHENDKNVDFKKAVVEEGAGELKKDNPAAESPEEPKPVPVDNSMTLKEYEKILEEKRLAMLDLKREERKVVVDMDLKSMQPLPSKKTNNEIFAKLGSDKIKTKEVAVKEEKAKKALSLNPFCYPRGLGRDHGRGRGAREGYPDKVDESPTIKDNGHIPRGGNRNMPLAPPVNDDNHFPYLGGK